MRCPDCNKFVSMDAESDPEFDEPTPEQVLEGCSVDVRITNNCAECGTELKEANLSIELPAGEEHDEHIDDLELEFSVERTDEGGGRYKKSYYGVSITAIVTCKAKTCAFKHEVTAEDKCQAAAMDELV